MSKVFDEDKISLSHAARLAVFRTNGRSPHRCAVYRWANAGVKAVNGETIRLETVRTPAGLVTSEAACIRFLEKLTDPDSTPSGITDKKRKSLVEDSNRELQALGVK